MTRAEFVNILSSVLTGLAIALIVAISGGPGWAAAGFFATIYFVTVRR